MVLLLDVGRAAFEVGLTGLPLKWGGGADFEEGVAGKQSHGGYFVFAYWARILGVRLYCVTIIVIDSWLCQIT